MISSEKGAKVRRSCGTAPELRLVGPSGLSTSLVSLSESVSL